MIVRGAIALVASTALAQPYTLRISGASSLAVNVTLFANLPYDPRRDLTPITKVVDTPTMLVVPAGSSPRIA